MKAKRTSSGVDVKCPHCDKWLSEGKDWHHIPTDFGFAYQCHECKMYSYWDTIHLPAPVECDHTGKIIEDFVKDECLHKNVEWDYSVLLTSDPPKYRGTCKDCGKTVYKVTRIESNDV